MLTAVEGYYNGSQIVMDEGVTLRKGQRVIITILDPLSEPPKAHVNLNKYVGRGEKLFNGDAGEHVKELRSHDRV